MWQNVIKEKKWPHDRVILDIFEEKVSNKLLCDTRKPAFFLEQLH